MRLLLDKKSRNYLFDYLREKYHCSSLCKLSKIINIPVGTLEEWKYNSERYLPEEFIPPEIFSYLKIIDKQEDSWGNKKGGKKTYQILIKKYGKEEINRRQSNGGRKSKRIYSDEFFKIDVENKYFLEFYGILLGDGWLSKLKYKNKVTYLIGISGHYSLDIEFFFYLKENIKELFNRSAYIKNRLKYNSIELNFANKSLLNFLNRELSFPIGKKIDLKISEKIYAMDFNNLRHVIRGIFDTDGTFYLDKDPLGRPYPCIMINMKSPLLIKQLNDILIKEGFKVTYVPKRDRIFLKGRKQLSKWMKEIGSSNKKHIDKINALVAQPG